MNKLQERYDKAARAVDQAKASGVREGFTALLEERQAAKVALLKWEKKHAKA
jgi:hypothetical protein